MEYITLNKLVNRYPTIGNYVAKVVGSIKLNGIYPTKNFIDFKISPINDIKLDDIMAIDNTKFQFVLGIKNKSSEMRPFKYFTSPSFFKNLQDSINEPNPYFILQALKKEFIVEYSLEEDVNILKDLVKLENEDNVKFKNHLWFLEDGTVDFKKLVQYIDWVVSTPTETDAINLGVIPISQILTKADYKVEKLKLKELPSSQNTVAQGGGTTSNNNSNPSFSNSDVGGGSGGSGGGGGNVYAGGTGYSGRPGDASTSNANYLGNQYDQFPNQYGG